MPPTPRHPQGFPYSKANPDGDDHDDDWEGPVVKPILQNTINWKDANIDGQPALFAFPSLFAAKTRSRGDSVNSVASSHTSGIASADGDSIFSKGHGSQSSMSSTGSFEYDSKPTPSDPAIKKFSVSVLLTYLTNAHCDLHEPDRSDLIAFILNNSALAFDSRSHNSNFRAVYEKFVTEDSGQMPAVLEESEKIIAVTCNALLAHIALLAKQEEECSMKLEMQRRELQRENKEHFDAEVKKRVQVKELNLVAGALRVNAQAKETKAELARLEAEKARLRQNALRVANKEYFEFFKSEEEALRNELVGGQLRLESKDLEIKRLNERVTRTIEKNEKQRLEEEAKHQAEIERVKKLVEESKRLKAEEKAKHKREKEEEETKHREEVQAYRKELRETTALVKKMEKDMVELNGKVDATKEVVIEELVEVKALLVTTSV